MMVVTDCVLEVLVSEYSRMILIRVDYLGSRVYCSETSWVYCPELTSWVYW